MASNTKGSNGFSPSQTRILNVLGDGMIHSRQELLKTLGNCTANTLRVHLAKLRRRLQAIDDELDIVSVTAAQTSAFRLVRLKFTTLNDIK